jgi:hypothetical protein
MRDGWAERLLDGLLGDLVEHHALVAIVVAADGLAQVPGDGLALAVEVRREVDGIGVLGQLAQLGNDFFLARAGSRSSLPSRAPGRCPCAAPAVRGLLLLVAGFFFRRHLARLRRLCGALLGIGGATAAGGWQVADVPDAGLHDKIIAQILVDRTGLGGRFDDDEDLPIGCEHLLVSMWRRSRRQSKGRIYIDVGALNGNIRGRNPRRDAHPVGADAIPDQGTAYRRTPRRQSTTVVEHLTLRCGQARTARGRNRQITKLDEQPGQGRRLTHLRRMSLSLAGHEMPEWRKRQQYNYCDDDIAIHAFVSRPM